MKIYTTKFKSLALMGVLMFAAPTTLFAQEEIKEEEEVSKPTFGGYLDTYMKQDFSGRDGNSLTSFTNSNNSFELGMASVYAEQTYKKASVFVDLGFGKRAEEFAYNNAPGQTNSNTQVLIKQAYLNYEVADGLKITMGSWGTHIGYELLNAYDNRNYSMSYAFSNGPFFNTGIKADYSYENFNFMFGATQPTDFRSAMEAGSHQKTFIGQIGYANDETSIYLNGTSGSTNPNPTNITQGDIVFNQKIDDKFSFSINATYASVSDDLVSGSRNWFSTVGYLKFDYSDKIKLTYRTEYFSDKKGATTSFSLKPFPFAGIDVFSNTISLNYLVGNLIITPEIRIDTASDQAFVKKDLTGTKFNGYAILAAAYKF